MKRVAAALMLATAIAVALTAAQAQTSGPRIEITFARAARSEAVTGMVYVAIARENTRTPIEQASPTGTPLFSTPVDAVGPGTPIVIDGDRRGHPIKSLRD